MSSVSTQHAPKERLRVDTNTDKSRLVTSLDIAVGEKRSMIEDESVENVSLDAVYFV